MKPQFWVDGSSGDKDLEEVIAKRYQEIWQRFKSAGFERDFAKYLEEKFELFKKKQASYGPNNIAALGMRGIFVRIWDKVQRLRNLVWEGKANTIEDESIEDTFGDLAVYSIMAVVLMRGQWPPYNDQPLDDAMKTLKDELREYLEKKPIYDKDRFQVEDGGKHIQYTPGKLAQMIGNDDTGVYK